VGHVICLVRGERPTGRVEDALQSRQLNADSEKWSAYAADLAKHQLGLDDQAFSRLQQEVTHIIHAAWPVNFQLGLAAFEPQIAGLKHLLDLSMITLRQQPARLLFCSSVSTAMGTPSPTTIKEIPIEDFTHALPQGYARSKLVSEHVVQAATKVGADAHVLRIGQIVGDMKTGVWNSTEAFPLAIQSALTLKVLPQLDVVSFVSVPEKGNLLTEARLVLGYLLIHWRLVSLTSSY
jgi:thioester reductase-like protein